MQLSVEYKDLEAEGLYDAGGLSTNLLKNKDNSPLLDIHANWMFY